MAASRLVTFLRLCNVSIFQIFRYMISQIRPDLVTPKKIRLHMLSDLCSLVTKCLTFAGRSGVNNYPSRFWMLIAEQLLVDIIWRSMCLQVNTCHILLDHTHVNRTFR